MQDKLEERDFQLWEKEGLQQYQEERLVNTEDLETEMAGFIARPGVVSSARVEGASRPVRCEIRPRRRDVGRGTAETSLPAQNAMAASLLASNATLPEGLVDQPYYSASGRGDDGPEVPEGALSRDRDRRRV